MLELYEFTWTGSSFCESDGLLLEFLLTFSELKSLRQVKSN